MHEEPLNTAELTEQVKLLLDDLLTVTHLMEIHRRQIHDIAQRLKHHMAQDHNAFIAPSPN